MPLNVAGGVYSAAVPPPCRITTPWLALPTLMALPAGTVANSGTTTGVLKRVFVAIAGIEGNAGQAVTVTVTVAVSELPPASRTV